MLTTDTITDEQIRELHWDAQGRVTSADLVERDQAFDALKCAHEALHRNLDACDGNGTWAKWRQRCADIINARTAAAITADTITTAQIREAREIDPERLSSEVVADALMYPPSPFEERKPHYMLVEARARCAEILNARKAT